MATFPSFSPNLKLTLIATGAQAGTWGDTTNTNLGYLLEESICGYITQAVTTGTSTILTMDQGVSCTARNMFIELTGTGGASTYLEVPDSTKLYFIYNNTSGAVTVRGAGGSGVSVPNGARYLLVYNGTDITSAISSNLTYSGTTNYLTKFSSSSAIGNSIIYDDGTNIGIGTGSPTATLDLIGSFAVRNSSLVFGNGLGATVNGSYVVLITATGSTTTFSALNIDPENNVVSLTPSADGKVGVGTAAPSAMLDVNSDTMRLRTAKTPASISAPGNAGDICWDSGYVYVCIDTNSWKRAALATW